MRVRLWALSAGFVLAGMTVPVSASDYVEWSGPGWYIIDSVAVVTYSFIGGPYSSEAECKAVLAPYQSANQETPGHMDADCDYYTKNPYGE
ncbi:MAG: hypothetical protein KGJ49_04135 [Alphaproteobacteria bacterium]|nr:hypothetical protein [Alphaproteobacteria bacterium]